MLDSNPDYAERVVLSVDAMPYVPCPAPGVWRKRLELLGDSESGRVTSVVRFDPGARFPEHDHPQGEEIFVLEGEFCDERGCFGPGTFQLNPEGFRHAPYTPSGCLLFVKLRQYTGAEVVLVDTHAGAWGGRGLVGVRSLTLHGSAESGEYTRLTELAPGTKVNRIELREGEELFVLRGAFSDEYGRYERHTWLRMPPGSHHAPETERGCLLYVKSGGFPPQPREFR